MTTMSVCVRQPVCSPYLLHLFISFAVVSKLLLCSDVGFLIADGNLEEKGEIVKLASD